MPYPPDYGGMIDIFYKVKALSELGVEVHLHCFRYGREESVELEKLCHKVYYYDRKLPFYKLLSIQPFIVITRKVPMLLKNLCTDQSPILFEGLHCTAYIHSPLLEERVKVVRTHNIEHDYYSLLSKVEKKFYLKYYLKLEALKLRFYEKQLNYADQLLAISPLDYHYFRNHYGKTTYLPAFHSNSNVCISEGKGDYILMHGNLEVKENEASILFLIENIIQQVSHPIVVAGRNPSPHLSDVIDRYPNIRLVRNPSLLEMDDLQQNAQIVLLHTFQATGLKLKLLNSLFRCRHIICNDLMVDKTGLESLCHKASAPSDWIGTINDLFDRPFTREMIDKRTHILDNGFSNHSNARFLVDLIFHHLK